MKKLVSFLICLPIMFLVACDNKTALSSNNAKDNTEEDSAVSNMSDSNYNINSAIDFSKLEHRNDNSNNPQVYFTSDISSDGLMNIYKALGASPEGKVAVKLHTGESDNTNYLRPELITNLIQNLNASIVECNTAYGGNRANTANHLQIAKDHGFTDIADVDIMDADGSISIPITGGTHLKEDYVGKNFTNYDYFVVLSHFKGHQMGGFGGAIKNTSIGIASSSGKSLIHSAGKESSGFSMDTNQDDFLESMAEAAKGVYDYMDGKMLFINVMNRLSVDCDCNANPAEPDMHDIGILASFDPVALDQACVDLVYAAPDSQSLIKRMESLHGIHTLEHAEEIGLGSRAYSLVKIDD